MSLLIDFPWKRQFNFNVHKLHIDFLVLAVSERPKEFATM